MNNLTDLPVLLPFPRYLVPAEGELTLADDLLDGAPTPNEALYEEAEAPIERFAEVWHGRHRPGGFDDNVARMMAMRDDYR